MYSQQYVPPPPPPNAPPLSYGPVDHTQPGVYGYATPPVHSYITSPPSFDPHAGPSTAPPQSYSPYTPVARPLPHSSSVQSIPEPARRAEYQAPVFKTFQERKREREAALRAAVEGTTPRAPPRNTPPNGSPAQTRPTTSAAAVPDVSVRPLPPPSALRMMGAPSGTPPAPPPRAPRALPVAQPQPQLPSQSWNGVPSVSAPVSDHILPAPSPGPGIPAIVVPTSPDSPGMPPNIALPVHSPPRSASPAPAGPSQRPLPDTGSNIAGPRSAAISAIVERSDTVSSVKSLDRVGFGPSRRALPRPPVGVAPSKSLDRGNLPAMDMRRLPRRGPSPVPEEDTASLAARLAGVSVGGIVPGSPRSPPSTASSPFSPMTPRDISPPMSAESTSRAMSPLPTISLDGAPVTPKVPSISISNEPSAQPVPSIAIACEPEAPKPPGVPTISIGGVESPRFSVSPPSISVNPPSRPTSPAFAISAAPAIEVSSSHTHAQPTSSPHPTRIHTNSAILCAGCTNPIIGRIVSAMNQRWHPQCFMCGVCNELLEHVSAYEHEGKPYCHLDYHDRFAHKCHHCQTPIVDSSFVTLDDENLGQRYYHELHFFCSECGDPFLDPSKSSAPGGLAQGEETNPFVIHKGHPYCERCHLRLHKPKCRKCTKPIPDVAVSAMGSKWHAECFVCDNCDGPFGNNLFFPKEGRAYCTECFERM